MNDEKKPLKVALFFGKLAITFAALYLVWRQIEPDVLKDLLVHSQTGYLLLAFVVFILAKLFEARRANTFFRALNIEMSETSNAKLYLLGMFYNLFLPAGIGGDSYRAYWIKKQFKTGLKDLITSFLLNRINGLVALLSLLLIAGMYVVEIHPLLAYGYLLIPLGIAVYFLGVIKIFPVYKKTTTTATTYSFLIQGLQLVSALLVLYAFGVEGKFGAYSFMFLISGIAFMVLPFFGGYGSREVVFYFGAEYLQIDYDACLALILVIYVMRALVSLGGAYFLMYPDKILDKS